MRTSSLSIGVFLLFIAPLASASFFPDVPENAQYREAIEVVYEKGIVQGYPDGTFGPERTILRAEMAQMLAKRYDDTDLTNCRRYPDVKESSWKHAPICILTKKGATQGYPDGTFGPDQTIRFTEIFKMASIVYDLPIDESYASIKWYWPYFAALETAGAVPPTFTDFAGEPTRGELAYIVARLEEYEVPVYEEPKPIVDIEVMQ